MAYSSEEIQAAVERLVKGGISRPVDSHGVRQVDVQFDDIREAAAGVFITYPDAPYSVLSLGCDRLNGEVAALIHDLTILSDRLMTTLRPTSNIKDLAPLADATTALVELETALGTRTGGIKDPATMPSYLRFAKASQEYLATIGANVKSNGDIVETPNQARLLIPSSFKGIMVSYESILDKQLTLRAGLEDYTGMQLPAKVTQAVVARARQLLDADQGELSSMTEAERLEVARDKTLNVLSARSIVAAYLAGQKVNSSYAFTGLVRPYSDTNHAAIPAVVTGDVMGPFALVSYPVLFGDPPDPRDNNVLEFTHEGVVTTVTLPACLLAFLLGSGRPQWDDDVGDKVFTFYKKGPNIPDPPNPDVPNPGYAENFTGNEDKPDVWYFPPENYLLYVDQYIEGGATTHFTVDFMAGMPPMPFMPDGGNPYPWNLPWTAYKVKFTLLQVVAAIEAALTGSYIRCVAKYLGADPLEPTNVQIECIDPIDSVVTRRVGIRTPSVLVGGVETNTAAQNPLGFVPGLEMMTRRLSAPEIVTAVQASSSKINAALAAVPRAPDLNHMKAWTDMANAAGCVLAKWTGTADVSSSGTTATITAPVGSTTFTSCGVAVGDYVAFPRQYVSSLGVFAPIADEAALYHVTSASDYVLVATKVSGPTALSYHYRVLDVGLPDVLSQVQVHDVVQIYTAPNDGGYEVTALNLYSPFRVTFGVMLGQTQAARDSLPIELECSVGPATVAFSSADTTTASSISVAGSGLGLFFTSPPSAHGVTEYVQVPAGGPKLSRDDRLTFVTSTVPYAAFLRGVKNVENRILTLDGTVPSNVDFAAGSTAPPYVEILSGKKLTFSSFKLNLESWDKTQPVDASTYAANTNAALNPLLANQVPPLGKVQDAQSAIAVLRAKLVALSVELSAQIGPVISPVNDLINTLKAKGCDRGVDLLLEGRFSTFFGLDMDDMSYAGAMQKAAREVARNDLAKSKFGGSRIQRKIVGMQTGSDPDYDHSDSDALASPPDQVSGLDLISSPDRI